MSPSGIAARAPAYCLLNSSGESDIIIILLGLFLTLENMKASRKPALVTRFVTAIGQQGEVRTKRERHPVVRYWVFIHVQRPKSLATF
jgi:hypothetical protein